LIFLYFYYILDFMKRILLFIVVLLIGMAAFGQELLFYSERYKEAESSFEQRLNILQTVKERDVGTGEFYHEALKLLLLRAPDITKVTTERRNAEQRALESSVVIVSDGLGKAKVTAAQTDLWSAVNLVDTDGNAQEGHAMRAALYALGQVDAKDHVEKIAKRLHDYNRQVPLAGSNNPARRRVQQGVMGCIEALEALKDIRGYRSVFFASVPRAWYDKVVKDLAIAALPNIVDDPSDEIAFIIRMDDSEPEVKQRAFDEMKKNTKMPDESRAKVAAAALEVGHAYKTQNRNYSKIMRELRKDAIQMIRRCGVASDSVYLDLERSYKVNFESNDVDEDEIMHTLNALGALKTDQAVALLYKFLSQIEDRRSKSVWTNKERKMFTWILPCLSLTGTKSEDVRKLLVAMKDNAKYTSQERAMILRTMKDLGFE